MSRESQLPGLYMSRESQLSMDYACPGSHNSLGYAWPGIHNLPWESQLTNDSQVHGGVYMYVYFPCCWPSTPLCITYTTRTSRLRMLNSLGTRESWHHGNQTVGSHDCQVIIHQGSHFLIAPLASQWILGGYKNCKYLKIPVMERENNQWQVAHVHEHVSTSLSQHQTC